MDCPSCGSQNPESNRFCGGCGNALELVCSNCSSTNPLDHRFCGACGTALGSAQTASPSIPVGGSQSDDGERRHLTVMFCDLVGSTVLSEQLDPEEMRELIRRYQQAAGEIIARYDGYIAQYLGDGILVYFGYPRAHEQDPERAVRAGLELVARIRKFESSSLNSLKIRIGIHTGQVVVGEMGTGARREHLALGDVPNIASSVQSTAEAGDVLITASTFRLVDGLFETEALGPTNIKPGATPIEISRVLRDSAAQSRFDVELRTGLNSIVGRGSEVDLLSEKWNKSVAGDGQIVLLNGEPGIGKSRLVHEVKAVVGRGDATQIEMRCSPYHQNSALFPIVEHLRRYLEFAVEDSPEQKFNKLREKLVRFDVIIEEGLPLLASLLSIPLTDDFAPLALSPEQQKQQTQATLVNWMLAESELRPLCVFWEDLHWADASTLEVVEMLYRQLPNARVLAVATFRPEFVAPWGSTSYQTQISLSRLGASEVIDLVKRVAGKPLPTVVTEQIVSKTDGVPLFVEELTKMVIESNLVTEHDDAYTLTGELPALAIPSTLQDSLMARLDNIGIARELAQIGAAIGREFSHELIRKVSELDDSTLQQRLSELIAAELVFQRGIPPQANYTFKHALVRDTAYDSLLKSARLTLHHRIAKTLESEFPHVIENEPELLALHFSNANHHAEAIEYWRRAGELAIRRSANIEAAQHLRKGLEEIPHLPSNIDRPRMELSILARLGPALIASRGYGAIETANCFDRARELTAQVENPPELFPVLYGCWVYKLTWAEFDTVKTMAEEFLRLAEERRETSAILTGHRILGFSLSCLGEFADARDSFERLLNLYKPDKHSALAYRYGQDPKAAGASMRAWNLWHLGYPDQAIRDCEEAVEFARDLNHTNTRGYVETFGAARIHLFRRDVAGVEKYVKDMTALCDDQNLVFWIGFVQTFRGWLEREQGHPARAVETIRGGLETLANTGTAMFKPHALALLAEAYADNGQVNEGLRSLEDAVAISKRTAEFWILPELYRLKAALLLRSSDDSNTLSSAEHLFETAMSQARKCGARSWELRAAMGYADAKRRRGDSQAGKQLLQPIFNEFSEGFATRDLIDAQRLLHEL